MKVVNDHRVTEMKRDGAVNIVPNNSAKFSYVSLWTFKRNTNHFIVDKTTNGQPNLGIIIDLTLILPWRHHCLNFMDKKQHPGIIKSRLQVTGISHVIYFAMYSDPNLIEHLWGDSKRRISVRDRLLCSYEHCG